MWMLNVHSPIKLKSHNFHWHVYFNKTIAAHLQSIKSDSRPGFLSVKLIFFTNKTAYEISYITWNEIEYGFEV